MGAGMDGSAARRSRWWDLLWLAAWGLASSLGCLSAAAEIGATFDEPLYLQRGLECWRTGSHRGLVRLGTMPLPIDVQTLPLFLYEKYTGQALDPVGDCGRLLPVARAGTLVFWWALLAYGLALGRRIAGPWGGRAAVALLACEPNLLAHASLATTDIAVSAALLALVYHFDAGRGAGWGRRIGLPAVCLASAILAKASGLVFGPLALFAVETGRLIRTAAWGGWRPRALWETFAPFRRDATQVMALGLALTFIYCGSDWQPEASFVTWAQKLPEGPARTVMVPFAENLRIFSNAGEGIVRQVRHNVRGHGVFLLGEVHPRALWYYFPTALAIKLPVPLLLLALVLLLLRPRALTNAAGLAAGALLLFSLTCRVQIGIRLVLPLVVLGIVGVAAAAVVVFRERTRLGYVPGVVLAVGVLWTIGATVRVWPHGLCYANELWGGSERTYLCLSDSNFDWGQGLPELARWQEAHGVAQLDLWYFGTDPAVRRMAVREVPLHALPAEDFAQLRSHISGRYLAVGATLVYGMASPTPSHQRAAVLLRQQEPVGRAGTFLIYDLGGPAVTGNGSTE